MKHLNLFGGGYLGQVLGILEGFSIKPTLQQKGKSIIKKTMLSGVMDKK
jgi:hypothetical protein